MSELIQKNETGSFRWELLAGASVLALMGHVAAMPVAKAEENDRPTVWIELGGQLSRLQDGQEAFAPPFVALTPPNLTPPQNAERAPLYGMDASGKVSIQPENSNWIFSASIRYGRATSAKHTRHQSYPAPFNAVNRVFGTYYGVYFHNTNVVPKSAVAARFTDAAVRDSESHAILDFQAGKDLGVGLFGRDTSFLNVGVRIAQFQSKLRAALGENPDWQFKTQHKTFHFSAHYSGYDYNRYIVQQKTLQPYHSFAATFRADRSFNGLGPSISWNSSVPVMGMQNRGLLLDWGANAALLFGRQKTTTHHQTTALYHASPGVYGYRAIVYQHPATPDHIRSRNVIVPNIGGFAGISFKYPNAKVSFGYRADFFFGAIDGGIDARKTYDRNFYGPFATVSIGLGG